MRTARLGEILEVQNGFAFNSDFFSENEGMPLIRIRDLKNGILTETKYKGSYDSSFIVKKGDYLIGMDGEFRCYEWKGEDALLNQRVCRLKAFDRSIYPMYLFYGINTHLAKIERNTSFVTVKHISSKQIKEIQFLFPPLEDQIHIANILSKAEALIAQRKESLRLLDEFLKSTFLEMFGSSNKDFKKWSVFNISNLAEQKKGSMRTGPFGSDLLHSEFIDNGPVRVLGIDNVVNNRFEWSSIRCISLKKFEGLKRYQVFPNDVLISIMATNGRTAVVPENIPKCINSKHLAAITVDRNRVDPIFLSFSFHSDPQILKQLSNQTRGAIMGGLNLTIIKGLKLKLPPLKLQTQFARIVKKTDELKAHYQTSLQELENLYGSLSQRAFSPAGNLLKAGKGELKLKGEEPDSYRVSMAAEPKTRYKTVKMR